MADYGLTNQGVNIKRLDTILEEMHEDLTDAWGVNTQQNSSSLLNVLLTNIADRIAELWELGMDVYNSQYPTTAEGMYLDNVGQFAGVTREDAAPSYYHILCTGIDGTAISANSVIASETSPVTYLNPVKDEEISRDNFNIAVVKVVSIDGNPLTVDLNGDVYSVAADSGTSSADLLEALASAIDNDDFTVYVDEDDGMLHIEAVNVTSTNTLVLSDNLTTDSVGCVFTYATEENGDIYLPEGAITEITKSITGLTSVVNVGTYIAGREVETDTEYRQSYLKKIFARAARMVDSIRSAILENCQGVTSVSVYENDSDETDDEGRYPHSIEVVCDGGDDTEIAQQILNTKAAGISTYGDTVVTLVGEFDEELIIRFNRPEYLNLWVYCEVTATQGSSLPSDYADLIRGVIVEQVGLLECGDDVIPQSIFLPDIYSSVSNVGYVEILMETGDEQPDEYTQHNIQVSNRERATIDESMIEVVISG